MEQHHTLDLSEPVSPEELRALIERFGERQLAPSSQPTVRDVAETLQVEPTTVAAMLREYRESKSQAEIKERLDRLERENAELRARTESPFLLEPGREGPPRSARVALLAGLVSVLILTLVTRKLGTGPSSTPFFLLVVFGLVALMYFKHTITRPRK